MPKIKGPTWDDIHKTGANNIESRDCGGYGRILRGMGKTRVELTCPFCKVPVTAYLWSLAGGGKRCDCGAMAGRDGTFHHFADRAGTPS